MDAVAVQRKGKGKSNWDRLNWRNGYSLKERREHIVATKDNLLSITITKSHQNGFVYSLIESIGTIPSLCHLLCHHCHHPNLPHQSFAHTLWASTKKSFTRGRMRKWFPKEKKGNIKYQKKRHNIKSCKIQYKLDWYCTNMKYCFNQFLILFIQLLLLYNSSWTWSVNTCSTHS